MKKTIAVIFALMICLMSMAMDQPLEYTDPPLTKNDVIINILPFTPWNVQTNIALTCNSLSSAVMKYRSINKKEIAQFNNTPISIVFCSSGNKFCSVEYAEYQSKPGSQLRIFDACTLEARDVFLDNITTQDKFASHERGLCCANGSTIGLIEVENDEEILLKPLFPNPEQCWGLYCFGDFIVAYYGHRHEIFDIASNAHKGLSLNDVYNVARCGDSIHFFCPGDNDFDAIGVPNFAVHRSTKKPIICCVSNAELMVTCFKNSEEQAFDYFYAPRQGQENAIVSTGLTKYATTRINLKLSATLIAKQLFLREKMLLIFATNQGNTTWALTAFSLEEKSIIAHNQYFEKPPVEVHFAGNCFFTVFRDFETNDPIRIIAYSIGKWLRPCSNSGL
jgi:hypothetical protein